MMVLTTEEVLSIAAGELLAIRRKPEPIQLRCRPKLPTLHRKPKAVKVRYAPEPVTLSQTAELLGWLDQIFPPTALAPMPKQEDRSPRPKPWTNAECSMESGGIEVQAASFPKFTMTGQENQAVILQFSEMGE